MALSPKDLKQFTVEELRKLQALEEEIDQGLRGGYLNSGKISVVLAGRSILPRFQEELRRRYTYSQKEGWLSVEFEKFSKHGEDHTVITLTATPGH